MAFDHQGEVEHSGLGEVELSELVAQEYACNDCSTRRAKTASEGDFVVHMDGDVVGELGYVVTAENVECDTRRKVLVCVEWDFIRALARVEECRREVR